VIVCGFHDLTKEHSVQPYACYNLSIALILLRGLAVPGNITITMTGGPLRKPSRVLILSGVFTIGLVILILILILSLLYISTVLVIYLKASKDTRGSKIQFVDYCRLIVWLICGHGLCFRFFIEDVGLKKFDFSKLF
jgi:hypothetical protein